MSQVIRISKTHFEDIVARLSRLEKLMAKMLEQKPEEGTSEWWDRAHKKGMEAKRKGQFTRLKTKVDLENFFKTL